MAVQIPGPAADWQPIAGSSQFIDAAASTALTVPAVPTSAGRATVGAQLVAILLAQGASHWIRTDGSAVAAAYTGGIKLVPDTFVIVYGKSALDGVRVIRESSGGSLAVSYYWFRPGS